MQLPSPQSATLGLHPVPTTAELLLTSHPNRPHITQLRMKNATRPTVVENDTHEQLILSQNERTARVYCEESTPSLVFSLLLLAALPPCALDELIGRCSDVGTTTVSRPDDRFCSNVLYSVPHLPRNSATETTTKCYCW